MSADENVIARPLVARWVDRLTPDRTVTILLFLAIFFAACFTPAQNDTWWHLRAGEESWRLGAVQLRDTFSHTAYGTYWPNQEWLGEVVLYALYSAGGLPLMTAFAAVLITASWALVWAVTPGPVMRRAPLCAVALMSCAREWSLRPKLFTLFFVAVTIFLIASEGADGSAGHFARRRYYLLPPLFALWANLHGGVMLGVVIVFASAAAASAAARRVWHPLAGVAIASALATSATPLGFSLWPEIVSSLGRIRQLGIQEWAPASLFDPLLAPFWVVGAALVVLAVAARVWRAEEPAALLAWPALALIPLAIRAGRNAPPALMLAVPAIAMLVEGRIPFQARPTRVRPLLNALFVAGAAAVVFATVFGAWRRKDARLGWEPLSAAAARAVSSCPERLYNRYDEGGFLIWFAPQQKVFIDGRQDPYPPSLLFEQKQVERTGNYTALFQAHSIRCAFVPTGTIVAARLQHDGWVTRYADRQWRVLVEPSGTFESIERDRRDALDQADLAADRLANSPDDK
ncbi:MAG TPA: hypothetical protein VH417_00530 [Vicinamibacterales bacterium]|jgi:hypothetical protein